MRRYLIAVGAIAALLLTYVGVRAELSPLLSIYNADNVTLYAGTLVYPAGAFQPMGKIYTITAVAGTGTGTGAQTLGTYSLPANALDIAGRKLRVTALFTTAANTHNKTCTLNFGSEAVTTPTMATSAETASLQIWATKTGASTQTVWGNGIANVTPIAATYTAATETDTAAILITAICTDGTSAANDAVLADFFVEYMN